ncbi:radical SAM protein [Cardinium endosymbiont of Tipula unca]|uniref:radical SAM protein n=1 Tax=Cardinium endosymbiont of Tipula unca TaxID=3066216 RepID=UPI0030CE2AEE
MQLLPFTYSTPLIIKSEEPSAGIYLHIPFCKQACHYCNFHFSTNLQLKSLVVESMSKELALRRDYLGNDHITSIYFGGGTPSVLTLLEIEKLLNDVFNYFSIAKDIEITLEGNPDDLTLEKLQGFRSMGINRLSIGIQSFNDQILRFMNRAHTSILAKQSVAWARKAQFNNLNSRS